MCCCVTEGAPKGSVGRADPADGSGAGRSVGRFRPKIFAALRAAGVGRSAQSESVWGKIGRSGRSVGDN